MLSVAGIKSNNSKISFGRAPMGDEVPECRGTCKEAKDYLGIKYLALGMPRTSYPVVEGDLFVGSNMNEGAVKFNEFIDMFGFDSKQDIPHGLVTPEDPSPYGGTVFSKSYLNADMKKLTTGSYGNLLDMSDIMSKSSKEYEATSDMTDFKRAFQVFDELFEKAYDNLLKKTDEKSQNLKKEFEIFKSNNKNWLDSDAESSALRKKFGNNDFKNWPDNKVESPKELELYKFKQFIVNKQEKEFAKTYPKAPGIINDIMVGVSPQDVRANPGVFLKDFRIGAPGGGAGLAGQAAHQPWDLPFVDPKTIFNKDGSLGPGGIFLKRKISAFAENAKNVRIDNAHGWVNPWVYNKNYLEIIKDNDGNIVSTNAHGAYVSDMNWDNSFDPDHNYEKVFEKIVEPTLKEHGINLEDVAYETLGDQTPIFKKIFFEKLGLPEMRDLRWQKAQNLPKNSWMSISTLDTEPFTRVVQHNSDGSKDYFQLNKPKGEFFEPEYIVGFLHPEKTNEQREELIKNLNWDARLRYNLKNSELFRCGEKIQIFAMDFLGINKVYNHSGVKHPDNWKLRLPKNYQENYYKNLERQDWHDIALNMPEIFKRAIISKIYTAPTSKVEQDAEFARMKPLIDRLDKFEKILYEPEQLSSATGKIRNIVVRKLKEINLARLAKKAVA